MPPKKIANSLAISSREYATDRNLESQNLETIIVATGSPSYDVIRQVLELLLSQKALPRIEGVGIELGAGLALLSISLIQEDDQNLIEGILACLPRGPLLQATHDKTKFQIPKIPLTMSFSRSPLTCSIDLLPQRVLCGARP